MKKSILVVDDEELERELLRQIFESDYNVIMATNGKEALLQLSKHFDEIVIILLDLAMPVLNGYQVLQVLHASELYSNIPVAMITAANNQDTEITCYTMGAVSVVNKPFSAKIVRKQIDSIIEMYKGNNKIKESLTEQLRKTNYFYGNLIDSISGIAEFRVFDSGVHIKNIKELTKVIAEEYMKMFPDSGLTLGRIDIIVQAAAIHDIGKIAVPDNILKKPGPLTEEERQVVMSHTTKGCEIISMFADKGDEQFRITYDVCRSHHERYDGKGYPDGLVGDAIPLHAQIVALAHTYESLRSRRVYKQECDMRTVCRMIEVEKQGSFSTKILQCFERVKDRMEAVIKMNSK